MISDRKLEHLLICENYDVEFKDKTTGFEDIELIHNVLPEIDKNDIDLSTEVFGKKLDSPLFITAITGGHPAAKDVNKQLAIAAENNGIALGVGSQRAACEHPSGSGQRSHRRKSARRLPRSTQPQAWWRRY